MSDADVVCNCEDQESSYAPTPVNEKPITFRIYRGEPVEFELTYHNKDELYEALKKKIVEIGAPDGKLYYICYPFDYSLIESADDLAAAILPDRPLKLFTTAAQGDSTSTESSSSSDSSSEDDVSVRRRRHHHRRHSRGCDCSHRCQQPHHFHGHHFGSPWAPHPFPNPHFGCHHPVPCPHYAGHWGHCHH